MDMSFANQALSAEYLVKNHKSLEKKVYPVPEDLDKFDAHWHGSSWSRYGVKI